MDTFVLVFVSSQVSMSSWSPAPGLLPSLCAQQHSQVSSIQAKVGCYTGPNAVISTSLLVLLTQGPQVDRVWTW